jgi:hypothetical protein
MVIWWRWSHRVYGASTDAVPRITAETSRLRSKPLNERYGLIATVTLLPRFRRLPLPTEVEMGYAKATTDEEFSSIGSLLCRFGRHRHKLGGCAAAERHDTPFSRWRHRKRTIRVGAGRAAEVSAIQGRYHLSGGRGSLRSQTDCSRTTGLSATNSAFQFIECRVPMYRRPFGGRWTRRTSSCPPSRSSC